MQIGQIATVELSRGDGAVAGGDALIARRLLAGLEIGVRHALWIEPQRASGRPFQGTFDSLQALDAVTASAKAADAQSYDPSVISDPSTFTGEQQRAASAASSDPTDAMPSYPAVEAAPPPMAVMPAIPASPPQIPAR
jgi:hypothetical protein